MSFGRVAVTVLVMAGGFAAVPAVSPAQVTPDADPPVASAPASPAEPDADLEDPGCRPGDDGDEESLTDLQGADTDVESAPTDAQSAGAEPIARCSQNAGDQQYKDPFAGAEPPKAGGGAGPPDDDPQSPADGSQPTNDQSTGQASLLAGQSAADTGEAESASDAGPQLPNSGLDAGPLLAGGLALLLAGAVLRRRLA